MGNYEFGSWNLNFVSLYGIDYILSYVLLPLEIGSSVGVNSTEELLHAFEPWDLNFGSLYGRVLDFCLVPCDIQIISWS